MTWTDFETEVQRLRSGGVVTLATQTVFNFGDPRKCADDIVASVGFKPLGSRWLLIDAVEAREFLSALLHQDLAYGVEIMPMADATRLATYFTGLATTDTTFLTNLTNAAGRSWDSIASSTFDAGIIRVEPQNSSIIWFVDED